MAAFSEYPSSMFLPTEVLKVWTKRSASPFDAGLGG